MTRTIHSPLQDVPLKRTIGGWAARIEDHLVLFQKGEPGFRKWWYSQVQAETGRRERGRTLEECVQLTIENLTMLRTLQDLVDHFGASSPQNLNRRLYKDTACGASISVQTPDEEWHHNGEDWSGVTEIRAFTIQTIVEGSDATVDSPVFTLPVSIREISKWMDDMEAEAQILWDEANDPMNEKEDV